VRRNTYSEPEHTETVAQLPTGGPPANGGLPNRLMTVFEVAEFVGCHEETVRRAYLRGPPRLAAIRRQEPTLSPTRRPGLDRSRRAITSLVITERRRSMKGDDP
jgi:hypothetical protein